MTTRRKKPKKKSPPRKPAKRKYNYTPEIVEKIETTLSQTGNHTTAMQIAGVPSPTYYGWRKRYPDFEKKVLRACETFRVMINHDRPEIFIKSMENLEKLLTPQEYIEYDIIEKELIDTDKNEVVNLIERKTITHKRIRQPQWSAIEKVLGDKELRFIVMSAKGRLLKNGKGDFIQMLFGKWAEEARKAEDWDGNIMDDRVDLMRIRTMMADTQYAYDNEMISHEEYVKFTIEQHKLFSYIKNGIENRAQKILGGYSWDDIVIQMVTMMQDTINATERIANDETIPRSEIANEVVRFIKKTDRLYKRLSAKSSRSRPTSKT